MHLLLLLILGFSAQAQAQAQAKFFVWAFQGRLDSNLRYEEESQKLPNPLDPFFPRQFDPFLPHKVKWGTNSRYAMQ